MKQKHEAKVDPKDALKLLVICIDEFPDSYVREKFLSHTVHDQEELRELVGALTKHRPKIAAELLSKTKA